MTHTKSLSLSDRLLRYSATASLIASGTSLAASPIFATEGITDPDPDIVIVDGSDPALIDMNGDGTDEFSFQVSWTTSSSWLSRNPTGIESALAHRSPDGINIQPGTQIYTRQTKILMDNVPATDVQSVASGPELIGGYLPSALASGYTVSAAAGWAGMQPNAILTSSQYTYSRTSSGLTSTNQTQKGQWFNLTGSHYLGVKFYVGADTHFGWIELECHDADSGSHQLIIKAWGYNPTPDASIMTGYTPNAVDVTGIQASGGLQAITASAFAALGGALTWLRRKLRS